MIIERLQVEGFGVWTGLSVDPLDRGLNVFFGPNEAGKTTLLQFIRAMFYGFSAERRRYFPPLHGGEPGGNLCVTAGAGRFEITRHADGAGNVRGELALIGPDGMRQGEHMLAALMSEVDEAIFNNVFAISLQELQELATLSGQETAELLYRISAGLDRVSLVDVLKELAASRQRLISTNGEPCRVGALLAEREKLQAEIDELTTQGRRYGRLAVEHQQLDREIARLLEDQADLGRQLAIADLSIRLRPRWLERSRLDGELASLGQTPPIADDQLAKLDSLNSAIARRQEQADLFGMQREDLQTELQGLSVNEPLWRQAARIEAMGEQRAWIARLEEQIAAHEADIARIEAETNGRWERLGMDPSRFSGEVPQVSRRALAAMRPLAAALAECRRQWKQAEETAKTARDNAAAAVAELRTAAASRGDTDLTAAIARAGGELAQWRRRKQNDERSEQIANSVRRLEQQTRDLLERQLMPGWVLVSLVGVFALGVLLVVLGIFMPASVVGSLGWTLALLGVAGVGAAVGIKFAMDRANARQLEVCDRQLEILRSQEKQLAEEEASLERALPRGNSPLSGRIEEAERQLSALEKLVPLETRRQLAAQEAESAEQRAARAKSDVESALRRWRDALSQSGLATNLTRKQLSLLARHAAQSRQAARRLEKERQLLRERRAELDAVSARVRQLAADAGIAAEGRSVPQLLEALLVAVAQEQTRAQHRDQVAAQLRQVRRREVKSMEAVNRLKRRRRDLFRRANVETEEDFRALAARAAQAEALKQQRETIHREIAAAIAGHCSEESLAQRLTADLLPRLESIRDQFAARKTAVDRQLQERYEQRGRLSEQMDSLAQDRRLESRRFDLAMVEKRLLDTIRRWQSLAATGRLLDSIRDTYERQRQPETLKEASGYLERLTQGRYVRVWTPLSERTLRVDDSNGDSHPVEVLSRGTREQLFLALRLALATCYARRGARLPLVLDDVLVNFDTVRAKAAAAVLRDFAAGHQILVFTCHEHILKLFKAIHAPAITLPGNSEVGRHIGFEGGKKPERAARTEKRAAPRRSTKTPKSKPPEEPAAEPAEDLFAETDNEPDFDDYEWEEGEEEPDR